MKKIFLNFIVALIIVASNRVIAQESYKLPEAIGEVKNQINVCVIPQVELISIVQTISKYPMFLGFLMAKRNLLNIKLMS